MSVESMPVMPASEEMSVHSAEDQATMAERIQFIDEVLADLTPALTDLSEVFNDATTSAEVTQEEFDRVKRDLENCVKAADKLKAQKQALQATVSDMERMAA